MGISFSFHFSSRCSFFSTVDEDLVKSVLSIQSVLGNNFALIHEINKTGVKSVSHFVSEIFISQVVFNILISEVLFQFALCVKDFLSESLGCFNKSCCFCCELFCSINEAIKVVHSSKKTLCNGHFFSKLVSDIF